MENTSDDQRALGCTGMVICSCGSQLFEKSLRCSGWWKQLIDGSGEVEDTNLDAVRYGTEPKTVKCVECGRSNPNPSLSK